MPTNGVIAVDPSPPSSGDVSSFTKKGSPTELTATTSTTTGPSFASHTNGSPGSTGSTNSVGPSRSLSGARKAFASGDLARLKAAHGGASDSSRTDPEGAHVNPSPPGSSASPAGPGELHLKFDLPFSPNLSISICLCVHCFSFPAFLTYL